MAYKVTKADGQSVVVNDYAKEIVGGLQLLGYGFANYSDEIAQNFVKDLENNAGLAEPTNPVLGQFWFQLPTDSTSGIKALRVCVSTTALTLDARWKTLFNIDPSGNVLLDAWTLRGAAPGVAGGSSAQAGQVVIRNSSGKIDSSNIDFPSTSSVDTANKLANTRTFGSRNSGLPFNGTQNVPLTTAHIAEGDQPYFTTARARAAISATGAIDYDPVSGVISYNPPPSSAAVTHFNNRTGDVTLVLADVTGAGGANASLVPYYNDAAGLASAIGAKLNTSAYTAADILTKIKIVDGSDSGLDADLLDGHHYADVLAAAAAAGGGITSQGSKWVKFSNGFIICWGVQFFSANAYTSITFPVAFTTKPAFVVSGVPSGASHNAQDNWPATYDPNVTTTHGYAYNAADNTGNLNWIAIGF